MTGQTEDRVSAVHLDAVGGIAGDMFSAALLDARPALRAACEAAFEAMDLPQGIRPSWGPHDDGTLAGTRFTVEGLEHGHGDGRRWIDIRRRLEAADLAAGVRRAAIGIFSLLAGAEAKVHGTTAEEVTFHEVGAVDSILDILAAAAITAALGTCRWSVGPIPRGRGQVRTAHGVLPVPAPAVIELLAGYTLFDDGEDGERVTPTGAAILRYLDATQAADPACRRLLGAGLGFGTRRLAGRSNVLRATLYAAAGETVAGGDEVEVLRCEIDDQTAEDLAVAVEHLRRTAGVIDVCQWPVYGKKGRLATALQVLAEPDAAERVATEILNETTTLGLRRARQARTVVHREGRRAGGVEVKLAHRPSGLTAKAGIDDLAELKSASARDGVRREAEAEAMEEKARDDR